MSALDTWGKRDIVRAAKRRPCKDCGKSYPYYVMDFDHNGNEKNFNISTDLRRMSLEELIAELKLVDVVCSNCHREREHHRRTGS